MDSCTVGFIGTEMEAISSLMSIECLQPEQMLFERKLPSKGLVVTFSLGLTKSSSKMLSESYCELSGLRKENRLV